MMVLLGGLGAGFAAAQVPVRQNAAEIQLALKKLQVLASVLYVAAHPDDENTRLIAYLANGRLADTGYLAMTRGDGGQNLIGPEIGDLLGVIRSQELLAARRIDGGHQFFTRAKDFGFSKTPDETLEIWDQEQVLADVVSVFREFQPDVIITRFPAPGGDTHGHHTASAVLARDAYDAAGDPKRFPEQLDRMGAWHARRLVWNSSRFFYDKPEAFKPETLVKIDVGAFNPLLGASYSELAARSRSMHKSQGFGSSGTRGEIFEYFAPVAGDPARTDLFEGIDTTWGRIPGGLPVGTILERAYREFNPEDPARAVPALLEARAKLMSVPAGHWRDVKLADLDQVLAACLGLYVEAAAGSFSAAPGDTMKLNVEAANRSGVAVRLKRIEVAGAGSDTSFDQDLGGREAFKKAIDVVLPASLGDSQPYWLREKGTLGMFRVDEPALIGLPENPPALVARFTLDVAGTPLVVERPVVYKWNDPVRGEQYRPFELVPAITLSLSEGVFVFPEEAAREVVVTVRAGRGGQEGTARLDAPGGFTVSPASRAFSLATIGATASLAFTVHPPARPAGGTVRAVAEVGGRSYARGLVHIEHDHIPTQLVLPPAEAKLVRMDLKRKGTAVGYIQGAGDQVPAGLRELGFKVTELSQDELTPERLKSFDTVVLGIRAFNTLDRIRNHQADLFDYVKQGGTLIVQYTTLQEQKVDAVSPLPLHISHDRVTEEKAAVRFLIPDHPALNVPNKITAVDFEGWVQERGLYFADTWDPAFKAVLSCNDAGEPPRDGGLLVAPYGKGVFVYTGYSWFRQLPAGVPGAYRLFANLIALGH